MDMRRFTFRHSAGVVQAIEGQDFTFYPNRMALLEHARELAQPVAQAITILFADDSRDSTSSHKKQNGESDGEMFGHEETVTEAVTIEMAKYRQAERDRIHRQERQQQRLLPPGPRGDAHRALAGIQAEDPRPVLLFG